MIERWFWNYSYYINFKLHLRSCVDRIKILEKKISVLIINDRHKIFPDGKRLIFCWLVLKNQIIIYSCNVCQHVPLKNVGHVISQSSIRHSFKDLQSLRGTVTKNINTILRLIRNREVLGGELVNDRCKCFFFFINLIYPYIFISYSLIICVLRPASYKKSK